MVLASPGSGKTTTIVERVADLLRGGLPPQRILCVTFSRDAALEMRLQIAKITGLSEKTLRATVSTFHSLALRILRSEDSEGAGILSPGAVDKILREFVSKDNLPAQRAFNSRMRRQLISPNEAIVQANGRDLELAEVYGLYDQTLREEGTIDFDSMVYFAVEKLKASGETLMAYRAQFRYVIVDECHDTSHDQMVLAKLVAGGEHGSIMSVFDPSQQIYGWRGADAVTLLASVNGATRYFLPVNYRSRAEIIEAFKPFAEQDELSQKLVAQMAAARGAGGKVELHRFADAQLEAEAVCAEVKDSDVPENHAVLARTKALLLPYCEELERLGIAYHWRGRNFWASPEVEDAVAFCRLAIDAGDRTAWRTAITSPAVCAKYLGRKFAAAVADSAVTPLKLGHPKGEWPDYQVRKWREMRETVESLGRITQSKPQDFLRGMMFSTGLGVYDSQNGEEPDDFRRENLEALCRRAERFETLVEFCNHAAWMKRRARQNETKGVTLSTIHSAKGLEWKSVYVIGLSKDILPHKRSEDFDEERRLAYVALSRAKDRLWMSYHGEKSVFVNYLPNEISEVSHVFATEKAVTA